MGQVKRSVMIDAPVEEVFALMTDTERFGDWVFGFTELTEGPQHARLRMPPSAGR